MLSDLRYMKCVLSISIFLLVFQIPKLEAFSHKSCLMLFLYLSVPFLIIEQTWVGV